MQQRVVSLTAVSLSPMGVSGDYGEYGNTGNTGNTVTLYLTP